MLERRSKSNKKFMLLSAIGIFMVVDSHTFTAFNILGDFIPYNSFFMPMFVFISGYFNKVDNTTKLLPFIWKKVKTLLIPYVAISVLAFALQWLMDLLKTGEVPSYPPGYLAYMLERVVTVGSPFALITPMWFVITLFSLQLVYAVLKKFLYKIWKSYIMIIPFLLLNIFVVYSAHYMVEEALAVLLLPLKVLFFLPFLELGIIYRDYLEKKHTALSGGYKIGIMALMLVINMIRTVKLPMPYDVATDSLDDLTGFTSPYLVTPIISALVGIIFWLTFVDLAGKPVYDSRFVNYMSCNTFWIMGLHIPFFNLLNCIFMGISENIVALPYFDSEYFAESEWYYWEISNNIKIVYVIFGILGPLGIKLIYDLICSLIGKAINSHKGRQAV